MKLWKDVGNVTHLQEMEWSYEKLNEKSCMDEYIKSCANKKVF